MIVKIYIDESGTHGSPVTILGGWVGRLGQWAIFDPKWSKLLKRHELAFFHSHELRQSKGAFKGWSIAQKQDFMAAAARIALRSLEFGFTIILSEEDYRQRYVADERPKEVQLDSRYGLCFRYCLGLIPSLAMQAFNRRNLDISFILESGHPNFGDVIRIFNKVKESQVAHEMEIVQTLNGVTEGDKVDFPGLQIADVVAYNSFQHVTRKPFPTVELSPQNPEHYMTLAKERQRVPVLHMRLGAPELSKFRQFILDEVQEKRLRRQRAG
jgi:hypothetical protein